MLANHYAPASTDSNRADSDYDIILSALRDSARGRAFLEEHARRSRSAETASLLTAIARIEEILTSHGFQPALPVAVENHQRDDGPPIRTHAVASDAVRVLNPQVAVDCAVPGPDQTPPVETVRPKTRDPFADILALPYEEKIALFA
jgi:hypothetical protein